MPIIKSINGKKKNIKCIGCALKKGIISNELIYEGRNFEVRQDYEIPIQGFFVIGSKRHIVGFADFNKVEKKEFIEIICKLRKAMKKTLKINYVEYLCREDIIKSKINPSHFHMALLPKYKWMEKFSNVIQILNYAKNNMKTKKNTDKIKQQALKMKKILSR